MDENLRWKPAQSANNLRPEAVPAGKSRRGGRRGTPASYSWVRGMAIMWLVLGLFYLASCAHLYWLEKDYNPMLHQGTSKENLLFLWGFFGVLFTLGPVGVLLRRKWGYYGGMGLAALTIIAVPVFGMVLKIGAILGFPFGLVLGLMTIKALSDAKQAFGVR